MKVTIRLNQSLLKHPVLDFSWLSHLYLIMLLSPRAGDRRDVIREDIDGWAKRIGISKKMIRVAISHLTKMNLAEKLHPGSMYIKIKESSLIQIMDYDEDR